MSAHESGGTLERNAKVPLKCKFYDVFLKVRAPGTAIYDNLAKALGLSGASDNHRPSIKTARTPTAESCLGNNAMYVACVRVHITSGVQPLPPNVTPWKCMWECPVAHP